MSPDVLLLVTCLAFIIDQLFGEYPNPLHPVVWMGKMIESLQKHLLGHGPRWE